MASPDEPEPTARVADFATLTLGVMSEDDHAIGNRDGVFGVSLQRRGERFRFDDRLALFQATIGGEHFAAARGRLDRVRPGGAKSFPATDPSGDRQPLDEAETARVLAAARALLDHLRAAVERPDARLRVSGVRRADFDRVVDVGRRDPLGFAAALHQNPFAFIPQPVQLDDAAGRAIFREWLDAFPAEIAISRATARFASGELESPPTFSVRVVVPELTGEATYHVGGPGDAHVFLGERNFTIDGDGRVRFMTVHREPLRVYRATQGKLHEDPGAVRRDLPTEVEIWRDLMQGDRERPLGKALSAERVESIIGSLRYDLELTLRAIESGRARATEAVQHGGRKPEPDLGVERRGGGTPAYRVPPERGLERVAEWIRATLPNLGVAE